MQTNSDRVREFVERFPGRDDDEISAALKISPRQTVNIICRELERRGVLHRRHGDRGKIANFPKKLLAPNPKTTLVEPDIEGETIAAKPGRPKLTVDLLTSGGFTLAAQWVSATNGQFMSDRPLPQGRGVYAFVVDGRAQYVGLATMGIAKRLKFYVKPGLTQTTSQRLNKVLLDLLAAGQTILVYVAQPDRLTWNGLPVSCDAGLELGLIETFHLPWNIRGVR